MPVVTSAPPGEQPSTSRRLAWGGSGGSLRKRSSIPTKAAATSISGGNVGSVKMTRSSSREKFSLGEPAKEKDKGKGEVESMCNNMNGTLS